MTSGETNLEEWGNKFRDTVARYDILMDEIKTKLRSFKEMEKQDATEQEERRIEQMMMEMQLYMKKKEEDKAIKSHCNVLKVKLPKLEITRFNGTHIDWDRFWNQCESKIDRPELPAVSKFSYLQEVISLKVRVIIDGLTFTNEVCIRAKNILISMINKKEKKNKTMKTMENSKKSTGLSLNKLKEIIEDLVRMNDG